MGIFLGLALPVVIAILIHGLTRVYLDPAIETRHVIGEIDFSLFFYANIYMNPGKGERKELPERLGRMDEASNELRRLSCQLRARAHSVPLYTPAMFLCRLPKKDNVEEASKELVFLANSISQGDRHENDKARKRIQELLCLKDWQGDRYRPEHGRG